MYINSPPHSRGKPTNNRTIMSFLLSFRVFRVHVRSFLLSPVSSPSLSSLFVLIAAAIHLPNFCSRSPVEIESISGRVVRPWHPCLRKETRVGEAEVCIPSMLTSQGGKCWTWLWGSSMRVHAEGGIWTIEVLRWGRFSQRVQGQVRRAGESRGCVSGILPTWHRPQH